MQAWRRQMRSSAAVPADTQVSLHASPLAAAFRAGAVAPTAKSTSVGHSASPQTQSLSRSHCNRRESSLAPTTARTGKAYPAGKAKQSSILKFTAPASGTSGGQSQLRSPVLLSWAFKLRLHNPHQLCYVNSSVTAMLHVLNLVESTDLRPLVALCKQAANDETALALRTQLVVRSAVPRWIFNAEQKDASEFLLQYIQVSASTWSRWESRRLEEGALRITDDGGRMILRPFWRRIESLCPLCSADGARPLHQRCG